jgi:hypothetical protein
MHRGKLIVAAACSTTIAALPAEQFPAFLSSANQLLGSLRFRREDNP